MNDFLFYSLSTIISGILFFVLSIIKNRSKFWWTFYGIVECVGIIFISLAIYNFIEGVFVGLTGRIIFVILYAFVYLLFILFLRRSELTEREKVRIEKVNDFIFNIFLAMKQEDYDRSYSYIKNGLKLDPTNPILKQLEYSFEHSEYDYKKAREKLSIKYKLVLFWKNIKKLFGIKQKINIDDDVIDM